MHDDYIEDRRALAPPFVISKYFSLIKDSYGDHAVVKQERFINNEIKPDDQTKNMETMSSKKSITISEDKTGKSRMVYLNQAVQLMLNLLMRVKTLSADNYVFRSEGNRKAYLLLIERDADGNVVEVRTTGERYDENGNKREVAPTTVMTTSRWLKESFGQVYPELQISSYTFRQSYAYWLSKGWNEERYSACVTADFGHSSRALTEKHYMGVTKSELKNKQLSMNLGLEGILMYLGD